MDGSNGARVCSVTDALAVVGDRYSLLVMHRQRCMRDRFHQGVMGASTSILSRHDCFG